MSNTEEEGRNERAATAGTGTARSKTDIFDGGTEGRKEEGRSTFAFGAFFPSFFGDERLYESIDLRRLGHRLLKYHYESMKTLAVMTLFSAKYG